MSERPPRPEKLQKGGPKKVQSTKRVGLREAGVREWWKSRRAAKKRRLAAMTRKRRIWRRVGLTGTWLLGIIALFMVAAVVLFYTLSDVPRPEDLPLQQAAVILYADGSVMARIGTENRTLIKLKQVPEAVKWEVLAAEDRGFYSEPGFSFTGTARAAMSDLTGGDTQGGSGIAQQYAKNAYLSDSRTLTRKLKELAIAVKLSRQYSKDQILEFYLNTVYFGRGAYGIEAAAQTFFGVDVSKLTVAQGAVLAALLRAPSYYDPADNLDAAKARWKYVLDGMVSTKHLTQQQEDAQKFPKVQPPGKAALGVSASPEALIVQRVKAELEANGIDEAQINTRGLRITTTINHTAQTDAEQAVQQTFANLSPQQRNIKNALVAVNPADGGVLAYYGGPGGGKGYDGKQDYNDYAGVGTRPPGSSFKPFTLATVLSQTLKGDTPHKLAISSYVDGSYCTIIQGKQICNDPSDQGVSSKSITIANAMKYSLNTTFDELAVVAGPDNVAATAHDAGVAKKDGNGKPTLVDADGHTGFGIGIGDYAVRPIDQAIAFSTFANGGMRNTAYFVQSAVDSSGHIVYRHKSTTARALDPKVANDVTLTLEPIASYSGDPIDGGRPVAAKTGTEGIESGPDKGKNSDAWMVGFTPQVSAAVWVGSGNSNNAIYNSYGGNEYGRDLPGRTWQTFMNLFLSGKPILPMATHQEIAGGDNLAATPTPTPTKTKTTSAAPSTTAATSSSVPTPTPTPTTPTPTPTPTTTGCTPGGFRTCSSTPTPSGTTTTP